MGFIDTSTSTDLPVFFNVVQAVGKNCPNQMDDVKLVQFLLMAFYDKLPSEDRPKGNIGVTGFCGGATMNWILKFQLDVSAQHPGLIAVDNRVDRVRNKNLIGSLTGTIYTIATLNTNVLAHNPPAFFAVPGLIPLTNPLGVPPPTPDVVTPPGVQQPPPQIPEIPVPATGGV